MNNETKLTQIIETIASKIQSGILVKNIKIDLMSKTGSEELTNKLIRLAELHIKLG